jgi:hypothetical protein
VFLFAATTLSCEPGDGVQICVGCGKKAPETETNYTLISAQFGWRLTRQKRDDGEIVLEWRCPNCWRDFKRTRTGPAGSRAAKSSAPGPVAPEVVRSPSEEPSEAPPGGSTPPNAPQRRPGRFTR